jgi:putative toxin-antitoxin system antitoxin component (TIGR02293 family)
MTILLVMPNVVAKRGITKPRSILGGTLGLPDDDAVDVVQHLEKGFPFAALLRFQKTSGLTMSHIAELIRIPSRTLIRRKAKGRLELEESERLLRISRIFEKAVTLFEGDKDAARRWLTAPSDEFDGGPLLSFARTEVGAREVEDLIGRLEYGVFS